jgi:cupredoxin-like protein
VNVKTVGIAALVAILLTAGAYAFAFVTLREGEPREVVVIATAMTFVVDRPGARDTPNPPIVLHAGERVRLVLRNLDPGMRHDLIVEPLNLRTTALDYGESQGIVFKVPLEKGDGEYYCSFHSRLMRGRIEIR